MKSVNWKERSASHLLWHCSQRQFFYPMNLVAHNLKTVFLRLNFVLCNLIRYGYYWFTFQSQISHRLSNFQAEFTLANMLYSNFKSMLSFQVTTTNSEIRDSKTFQFVETLILRRKYFSKIRVKKWVHNGKYIHFMYLYSINNFISYKP